MNTQKFILLYMKIPRKIRDSFSFTTPRWINNSHKFRLFGIQFELPNDIELFWGDTVYSVCLRGKNENS